MHLPYLLITVILQRELKGTAYPAGGSPIEMNVCRLLIDNILIWSILIVLKEKDHILSQLVRRLHLFRLTRCLTLIVRVSTQHHIHTFTNELG